LASHASSIVGPAQTHKGNNRTTSAGSRENGLTKVFHNAAGSQVITRPIAKLLPTSVLPVAIRHKFMRRAGAEASG
jgi:hypothetical protein